MKKHLVNLADRLRLALSATPATARQENTPQHEDKGAADAPAEVQTQAVDYYPVFERYYRYQGYGPVFRWCFRYEDYGPAFERWHRHGG